MRALRPSNFNHLQMITLITYGERLKSARAVPTVLGPLFLTLFGYAALYGLKNTGLFISPSGTSELDCATTKKDRAERSISIGRESLKVLFCIRGLGVLAGSTARG